MIAFYVIVGSWAFMIQSILVSSPSFNLTHIVPFFESSSESYSTIFLKGPKKSSSEYDFKFLIHSVLKLYKDTCFSDVRRTKKKV
ncbi:hypothetical protein BpHYR1_006446 [Brachionus plicatilis]|uniref:Uncharacterized protein n=1 Tax=Brachionus plicatilis TaxID=10195 RepID=A0A3M7Q0M1_BRAPC|nr:hypothetical protein BpHYR1_006446 [Brachionus plicatilis]